MNFLRFISVLTAVAVLGCAAQDDAPAPRMESVCQEPRPQVCTMIFAPVCGRHFDGHTQTHSSDCNACADDTVVSHSPGACEDQEPTQ